PPLGRNASMNGPKNQRDDPSRKPSTGLRRLHSAIAIVIRPKKPPISITPNMPHSATSGCVAYSISIAHPSLSLASRRRWLEFERCHEQQVNDDHCPTIELVGDGLAPGSLGSHRTGCSTEPSFILTSIPQCREISLRAFSKRSQVRASAVGGGRTTL